MMYQYVAYTPQGAKMRGQVQADSEQAAEELLWGQDYTVVSVREVTKEAKSALFGAKIAKRDLVVFSRQLATLLESGIAVVRSLQLLQEQTDSKRLKEVLAEVIADVQQGLFFSEAILKHGTEFPPLYGRLIEVGEHAGNLEMVLRQLATYIEKEDEMVRKIRSAMSYPAFVMVLMVGVIFLMLAVALPPLMVLFKSFDAELPFATRLLIALTEFFSSYKFHILGGIFGVVIAFIIMLRTEKGRIAWDTLVLKIPLIRKVVIEGAVARMCRSMSTLLRAGISLPEIMDLVIRTQGNRVLRTKLTDVRNLMLQGQGLSTPLGEQKIFPNMLVQMVMVGEETGSLDSNMETLAIFYDDEVDIAVGKLTGALEPAMTIFIGLMVGFVAMAVITPMYSLMGSIG